MSTNLEIYEVQMLSQLMIISSRLCHPLESGLENQVNTVNLNAKCVNIYQRTIKNKITTE